MLQICVHLTDIMVYKRYNLVKCCSTAKNMMHSKHIKHELRGFCTCCFCHHLNRKHILSAQRPKPAGTSGIAQNSSWSNTDHEGADPALLLCALYTSPIFITARQAKSSAARQSCGFHSWLCLLYFLFLFGRGRHEKGHESTEIGAVTTTYSTDCHTYKFCAVQTGPLSRSANCNADYVRNKSVISSIPELSDGMTIVRCLSKTELMQNEGDRR